MIDFILGLLCVLFLLPFLAVAAAAAIIQRHYEEHRDAKKKRD